MYALHSDPCDDDVASSEHNKHSRTSLEEQAKKLELELVALTEQKQVNIKILEKAYVCMYDT